MGNRKGFSQFNNLIYTFIIWGAAVLISAIFLLIIGNLIWNGAAQISWEFLTKPPLNAGREGGISSILVSTALILGVSTSVSLPIGLGTSIYLSEFSSAKSKAGRFVRRSLDVLSGIPSIVFGLFGFAFFTKILGLGFSILSGGLTLACMVLPLLIRSTEEGLRSVPEDYKHGAAALGLSKTTTIFRILLPVAVPGLIAGVVLGTGRAIAETAALLFTSGYVDRMPTSFLDSGRALSVHIFDLSMNVPGGNEKAYASALILITLFLFMNIMAGVVGKYWIKGRTRNL